MRWRKQYENEFVRMLWKWGFVAVRAPNSGVSSLPYLDVFAWCPKNGKLFAFEVKSTSKEEVSSEYVRKMLTKKEAEKMQELKRRGVEVFIAVRLKGKRYVLYEVNEESIRRVELMLTSLCS